MQDEEGNIMLLEVLTDDNHTGALIVRNIAMSEGTITVEYKGTVVQKISLLISLATIIGLIVLSYIKNRKFEKRIYEK